MNYRCIDGKYLLISLSGSETNKLCGVCPALKKIIDNKKSSFDTEILDSNSRWMLLNIIINAAEKTGMTQLFDEPCEALNLDIITSGNELTIKVSRREAKDKFDKSNIFQVAPQTDTFPERRKLSVKIKSRSYIYGFDTFFDAYDCISALHSHNIIPQKCSLFKINRKYFVSMKIRHENRRIFNNIVCEFGKKMTSKTDCVFAEHAVLICEDFYNMKFDKN